MHTEIKHKIPRCKYRSTYSLRRFAFLMLNSEVNLTEFCWSHFQVGVYTAFPYLGIL